MDFIFFRVAHEPATDFVESRCGIHLLIYISFFLFLINP